MGGDQRVGGRLAHLHRAHFVFLPEHGEVLDRGRWNGHRRGAGWRCRAGFQDGGVQTHRFDCRNTGFF